MARIPVIADNLEKTLEERTRLLKESEERYRKFIVASPDAIGITGTDGCISYVSPKLLEIFGYQDENELIGHSPLEWVAPKDRERAAKNIGNIFQGGASPQTPYQLLRKDGTRFWGEIHSASLKDSEGRPNGLIAIIRDITERKQAEEALTASREELQKYLEIMESMILVLDTQGLVTLINRKGCEILGYSHEEIIGKNWFDNFIPERIRGERKGLFYRIMRGEMEVDVYREIPVLTKDGSDRMVAWHNSIIKNKNGEITGTLSSCQDITDRKKADEALARMAVLEAIGTLAGGIAHDFNNLLGGIYGYIELSKLEAEKSCQKKIADHLSKSLVALERAKILTRQLLTFSKGGAPIRKPQSLSAHVREAVSVSLSGSNVFPIFSIPDNVWMSNFDENQVSQVLDNIIINARQAMPKGGPIDVFVCNVPSWEVPEILPKIAYVRVSIRDYGIGISRENLPRIFDPFFTTKATGSGLGLAISYSIIKQHEGFIEVESEPGKGTVVHIYLPASSAQIPLPGGDASGHHQGKGRILVMDDEELILEVASLMLKSLGYDVATAKHGKEAREMVQNGLECGYPFVGAILDLTIPGGFGGKEIIKELLDLDPYIKAIVSSGYSDDPVLARPSEYGFVGSLSKPYRLKDLSQVLESLFRTSD